MARRFLLWTFFILLLISIPSPIPVHASASDTALAAGPYDLPDIAPIGLQEALTIENLQINIWPEYDRASVLVIYRITLSSSTSLPAQVNLRIPRAANTPFNVAMQSTDGLYNLKYTSVTAGEWIILSITAPSPNIQVEYYDPRLEKDGTKRHFVYRWPGDFTVKTMNIQIQKPSNATNMEIDPDLGSGQLGQDGLVYYDKTIGEVAAYTAYNLEISYEKPDDSLSVNLQPVVPVQPVNERTIGRVTFLELLPWVIAGLILLMIGGGIIWYWQSGRNTTDPYTVKKSFRMIQRSTSSIKNSVYCHECGTRANTGDIFCRTCGTRLRFE